MNALSLIVILKVVFCLSLKLILLYCNLLNRSSSGVETPETWNSFFYFSLSDLESSFPHVFYCGDR